jgi:hypothetical protein
VAPGDPSVSIGPGLKTTRSLRLGFASNLRELAERRTRRSCRNALDCLLRLLPLGELLLEALAQKGCPLWRDEDMGYGRSLLARRSIGQC